MASFLFRGAAVGVALLPFGLYLTFLVLAMDPFIQKHLIYLHKIQPFWEDTNQPQQWGFAKNQVTPFYLSTEDGESIYAWHVMPLPIYKKHEDVLRSRPEGFCNDITAADSFRILKEDPESKIVLYFHGNAGHLANAFRATSFHSITDTSNIHLLAIDYRGYGQSTGVPSEQGLILDASAAVDFVVQKVGIPPERIVLIGHSLGTAVAAAVAEKYSRSSAVSGVEKYERQHADFAGVILVAAFSSLPTMLSDYALAGYVPIMKPVKSFPRVFNWMMGWIIDRWESASRLTSLVGSIQESFKRNETPQRHLRLSLIHSADDWDIPSHEDDKLFTAAVGPLLAGTNTTLSTLDAAKAARTVQLGEDAFVAEWREAGVTIRQERFPYGGHNNIMKYAPVVMEVIRSFEEAESR